ncbi:hypothetical protein [Leptolyngbya sp. 7M]|uniref:hypothetical protein n=1 Tax=Leptolyngbya sp. 7M TaxID=2812896 RepID=UPI001B8B245E|nr:hypothetical protein [Leptolyngbya sp. 7M]QYO67176.1 hypothetical protein JVX88_10445 [Leptolyngbya sp. 7M]
MQDRAAYLSAIRRFQCLEQRDLRQAKWDICEANGIIILPSSNTPTRASINNINNNSISRRTFRPGIGLSGVFVSNGSLSTQANINMNTNDFHNFGFVDTTSGFVVVIAVSSTALDQSLPAVRSLTFHSISRVL